MPLSAPIYRLKRRARQLAQSQGIQLHHGLNAVAHSEGYRSWDHLSAEQSATPQTHILKAIPKGGMGLLAARPGQGKTLLALKTALLAAQSGPSTFFTLDYSEAQIAERLKRIGVEHPPASFSADHSDQISAAYIAGLARPGFIAIDYLQLLDQRRDLPPLDAQCRDLRAFAQKTASQLLLIAQIHRSFDQSGAAFPGLSDIRLPNPVDLSLFDRKIFLHEGQISVH